MSLPCHDCFSDLLCGEDSTGLLSEEEPEDYYLGDIVLAADVEELMAELVAEERDYCPASDYRTRLLDETSAREEAVTWILKVHAYYHFQPLTAYLSVNYMDRFLASHGLPQANNGWPLQLLSVASLSLAAKMEETFVPSLLDLQVESARFIFEPRTIRRMELLVLNALNWRLRSVTPFDFIDFFALKMDPSGAYAGILVSHATQFILATIHGTKFLEHWPSSVAAAAIICAADSLPNLSLAYPGDAVSWCLGLNKENIVSCHALLQGVVVSNSSGKNNKLHKLPKVVSKLNARIPTELGFGDSSSSSGTTSQKRRKLNSLLWGCDSTSHSDSGDGI